MVEASSPSETIAKAMEGVTPPDKLHVVFSTWKEDGSLNIRRWSTFMEFDGSTVYIAEPVVNAITDERDALALKLEALQREMAELRAFASSFKLTCAEGSFYKDCYLHIYEPDAVSFRLGNGSQFSKFIANLEDRRARTLIQGEKK